MRIEFERSGGFAGIHLKASINVDELPEEDAQRIQSLIASADFFSLSHSIAAPVTMPDGFRYRISIDAGSQKHAISVDEAAAPPPLRALVQALTSWTQGHARRSGLSG